MSGRRLPILLSNSERIELERLAKRRSVTRELSIRARIVLAVADGLSQKNTAEIIGTNSATVSRWLRRFKAERVSGLYDRPRSGAPRQLTDQEIAEVVRLTCEASRPDGAEWSVRSMSAATGHTPAMINRIWKNLNLNPNAKNPGFSGIGQLNERGANIVGLYHSPTLKVLALSLHPLGNGLGPKSNRKSPLPEGRKHDGRTGITYSENVMFKALTRLNTEVEQNTETFRSDENSTKFLKFLRGIERNVPKNSSIQIVVENYDGVPPESAIRNWFIRHTRWHFYILQAGASWPRTVSTFIQTMSAKDNQGDPGNSLLQMENAIIDFIDQVDVRSHVFTWSCAVGNDDTN